MLIGRLAAVPVVAVSLLAHAASAVVITAGEAFVAPGEIVDIDVRLDSEGAAVAGVQADIEFPPEVAVQRRSSGRPDCRVNPDINKGGTSFGFVPCSTLPECETVRALVLALDNVEPIPDGSILYSCRVVLQQTSAGSFPLPVVRVGASDPAGNALEARGVPGLVSSGDPVFYSMQIGSAAIAAGGGADIGISVSPNGLGALRNEVLFDAGVPIVATETGLPQCASDVSGIDASFTFLPAGCRPGDTCSSVRADINGGGTALPDDRPLYRCRVEPRSDTMPGDYLVGCGETVGYDLSDGEVFVSCLGGLVSVLANPTVTTTPTATPTPVGTATSTASPTATVDPCGSCPRGAPCQIVNGAPICIINTLGGDDGCAIAPRPQRIDWLSALAFPLACWLLRRRARR